MELVRIPQPDEGAHFAFPEHGEDGIASNENRGCVGRLLVPLFAEARRRRFAGNMCRGSILGRRLQIGGWTQAYLRRYPSMVPWRQGASRWGKLLARAGSVPTRDRGLDEPDPRCSLACQLIGMWISGYSDGNLSPLGVTRARRSHASPGLLDIEPLGDSVTAPVVTATYRRVCAPGGEHPAFFPIEVRLLRLR